ncbi:thyroid peroxidase-like [Aplysia californica]|uniref:Thyroid peroxidase-like n=1 Tax=Aplysia californica TaxID=6500 RepID=A0ABM0K4R5_APLCA|nr:thyroid peroxidase-like [Aplysia californica]
MRNFPVNSLLDHLSRVPLDIPFGPQPDFGPSPGPFIDTGPCNPIYIPPLDRHFRYSCMNFARSQASPRKSDCNPRARKEPREQMNMLTAFIDASQVYGSTLKENRRIRLYRHGMLQVTPLDLLPNDKNSTCVKDGPGDYCFLAGEMRVNEHPSLSTLHTIFHRLHNQMALGLFELNPNWSDEKVSMSHVITFGHTLIPSKFTVGREKIRLFRMFNRPRFVLRDDGRSIGKFCSGLMEDHVQRYDRFIVNDLSDLLFQDRDNISMDLASLNIQRARDHGLPGYNEYREVCGMHRIKNFEQFYREDPERAVIFRRVYDHVDDIDLFPAGVSERSLPGAVVGSTFACIISQQFRNLKFGDRYWYENQNRPMAFTPGKGT